MADMHDVGYRVAKIQNEVVVHPFVVAYGYQENIEKLMRLYRLKKSPYKDWVFPINRSLGGGGDKTDDGRARCLARLRF